MPPRIPFPLGFHLLLLLLLLIVAASILPSAAESPSCVAVYNEGGAPAVLRSPQCPRWTLLQRRPSPPPPPQRGCHVAAHQGRRRSQEDRTFCALGIRIPFIGRTGIKEVDLGMVAVFDGHNGSEASDMASMLLLEYFLLHVYFLLDGIYSVVLKRPKEMLTFDQENLLQQVLNVNRGQSFHFIDWESSSLILPSIFDGAFHMEVLKESLLRTIYDIDSTFSKETTLKNLKSGSTATVVLIADGQILAANVGDSKAFLCSEDFSSHHKKGKWSLLKRQKRKRDSVPSTDELADLELSNYDGPAYVVKELTEDHHPDREDERSRVEAAGGFVLEWAGVVRVNGELALSRAIGDVPYKRYGVISTPEVTGWQSLSRNDTYLVAASDGVFEKMTTQEVCDLLWHENLRFKMKLQSSHIVKHHLAHPIVNTAFDRGTIDNIATVVVPLGSDDISGTASKHWYDLEESSDVVAFGLETISEIDATSSSILAMEYFDNLTAKFQRFLVEAKCKRFGCFYLSENLNEDMDYIFRVPEVHHNDDIHDLNETSPEPVLSNPSARPLELYKDQRFCWHFGLQDIEKGQCTSPEIFAMFVGLLDSLPSNDSKSRSPNSFGYKIPNTRYKLKKRFDRGSYGEVWLAFHWNCSQDGDVHRNLSHFASHIHLDCNMNTDTTSSCRNSSINLGDGDLFILKRIMVERGTAAYLSGLREKYFGEVFLNASFSLGGWPATEADLEFGCSDSLHMNISVDEMENIFHPMRKYAKNFRVMGVHYEEGLKHIARFIESFESETREIWLVFQNEGLSLSKLIYTAEETRLVTGDKREERARYIQVLQPSNWWYWLRTTKAGQKEMQNLIWQLLLALKACHDRNITHRDIKPENMILCFEDVDTGRCLREIPTKKKQYHLNLRIIDFGSAIDDFTVKHLYGAGPTRSEQTFEYTPPEALLNANWFQGPKSNRLKYDMWSVGVVMLELILGSPHVFQISDRTRALLDQHLEGWSEPTKELAYKLRSYMELCILIPGISSHHRQSGSAFDQSGVSPASWKCSEESFAHQVKTRDPLRLGFPNVWALRLVRQLLVWHPEDRLSVDEALRHPYFQWEP
ncbi:uncharacterized protein LOC109718161 isoform X2 [Ananas comosus]|uniref:protein-serine/threonine phosphatase n=1 Tax=Ananas comosus TaxID=4615 RepID=A0A6P5FU20_ANACO|nr:uncharacterized protein LOC109718161 isoform X2 [Ananas comosus]